MTMGVVRWRECVLMLHLESEIWTYRCSGDDVKIMMTKMVMIMMMLMMMMMMMMTLTTMLAAALWKVHRSFRDYIACLDMLGNALTMMIDVNQVQSILLRCWPMSSAILHPATDISAELSCRFITASMIPFWSKVQEATATIRFNTPKTRVRRLPTKIMAVAGYALGCAREVTKGTCMFYNEQTQSTESWYGRHMNNRFVFVCSCGILEALDESPYFPSKHILRYSQWSSRPLWKSSVANSSISKKGDDHHQQKQVYIRS